MVKECSRCGASSYAKGRCIACYRYWRRHNVERPTYRFAPRWCRTCKGVGVLHGKGYCKNCYDYRRRTGRARPRHLWDKEIGCLTCGMPLATATKPRRGRCNACYHYLRKKGVERPRELWGVVPEGWCECGFPAVARFEGIPVCSRHND